VTRPLRRSDHIVIFPVYLDSSRTKREGRRVSRFEGVPDPRVGEIAEACAKLGLDFRTEDQAAHPRDPTVRKGVVRVRRSGSKAASLGEVVLLIRQLRVEKAEKGKG
jgi:signal recognition particle subunit SRP19